MPSPLQPEPPARFLLYFEVGGTALTEESAGLLPEIEAEIGRRNAPNITVIGHTDTVGPAALKRKAGRQPGRRGARTVAGHRSGASSNRGDILWRESAVGADAGQCRRATKSAR